MAGQPGDVPAGAGQAGDEALLDRAGARGHHDRDGVGGVLQGPGRGAPVRDQDIDRQADQLGGEAGQPVGPPLGVAPLDDDVLPLDVAVVRQAQPEAVGPLLPAAAGQIPDAGEPGRALRADRQGRAPREQAEARQGQAALHELATAIRLHWMTSVAC